MGDGPRPTSFTGSALVRLLARLADGDTSDAKQAFTERLGQWLGWTDAISLSTALAGGCAATAAVAASPVAVRAAADIHVEAAECQRDCQRVRAALAQTIAQQAPAPARTAGRGPAAKAHLAASAEAPMARVADFAPFHRQYLAAQQAMDAGIGPLRDRLRAALTRRSPALARLASVDAVMAQVVGAHERRLLSGVPALLEKRFEGLRRAAPPTAADTPGAWLQVFRDDLQGVLLAELDLRFQPVEGLLDALRPGK